MTGLAKVASILKHTIGLFWGGLEWGEHCVPNAFWAHSVDCAQHPIDLTWCSSVDLY